jgi:methylmalonyl-CoA mutase cobalamin-binding domain/chain
VSLIRVVVADPGADGPDRTRADAVARALRDAGMEVVRTRDTSPAGLARAAVQEDADAVHPAGADPAALRELTARLAAEEAGDVLVSDPATPPTEIAAAIRAHLAS